MPANAGVKAVTARLQGSLKPSHGILGSWLLASACEWRWYARRRDGAWPAGGTPAFLKPSSYPSVDCYC